MPEIYWSCLSSKTSEVNLEDFDRVIKSGIDKIHCDVSNNQKTITIGDIITIRAKTDFPLDIHLAVENWIGVINEIGSVLGAHDCLSVQAELLESHDFQSFSELTSNIGCQSGLAVMPNFYSSEHIRKAFLAFDRCTVMAVTPGVTGMNFDFEAVRCINFVRKFHPECHVCLDGGISEKTVRLVSMLGVDAIVSGSFISSFAIPKDAVALISRNLKSKSNGMPRVGDLVQDCITLVSVNEADAIQTVLKQITAGGLGMVSVSDNSGSVIGIISDGDVRRALQSRAIKLELKAKDIVNTSPFCFVAEDDLSKLIELFCLDIRFDRPLIKCDDGYRVLPLNVVMEKLL